MVDFNVDPSGHIRLSRITEFQLRLFRDQNMVGLILETQQYRRSRLDRVQCGMTPGQAKIFGRKLLQIAQELE